MEKYIAVPKEYLQGLGHPLPKGAVELDEALLKTLTPATLMTDIAYAGHVPADNETSYDFFGKISPRESGNFYTNLDQAGRIPWSGRFKPYGLGMLVGAGLIGETDGVKDSDIDKVLKGSFCLQMGSGHKVALEGPNMLLFSQRANVGVSPIASPASTTETLRGILTSPFVGKNGFFPIPELESMSGDHRFNVAVSWEGVTWTNATVTVWFILFGKRITPLGG